MAFEIVAGPGHPSGTFPSLPSSPRVHRLNKGRGCVWGEEVSMCTYLEIEVKKGKKKDGELPVQRSEGIQVLRRIHSLSSS